MMFLQLVAVCGLCALWWLWHKRRAAQDPPEMSGWLPIIGHAHKIMGDGIRLYRSIERISKECLEKGGVITLDLGPHRIYGVADPDDCLTVMNSCLQKHRFFDYVKPLLGNGLLTADVQTWKEHRKLLNPAFNQQILDSYIGVFNSQAQRLVEMFADEVGKPFNQELLLRISNLETICSTSLGVEANEYNDLHKKYLPLLGKLLQRANDRIQKIWLHSDFIYNMTKTKKEQDEELKTLLALSKTIIQNKREEKMKLSGKESKKGKFKSFLDLILDLADETGCFTDDLIREHIDSVIGGGHDSTASILTFILAMLGSHQNVQEKAYKEIQEVLGKSDKTIDKDDLSKLAYIEAVFKETLRIYEPLPILARYIDKDVKLKNYTIKAKSDCFLLIHGLHRHSIWGPDADQFRPERWLEKETLPDPKYYASFGLGRRSCIGKVYATMSIKITLAYVLRNYIISSDSSKMVVKLHMMARPESGHFITLTPRKISSKLRVKA